MKLPAHITEEHVTAVTEAAKHLFECWQDFERAGEVPAAYETLGEALQAFYPDLKVIP